MTKMTEKIPAGEVYKGLAWAYLLNYLPLALLGTTADGRSKYQQKHRLSEIDFDLVDFSMHNLLWSYSGFTQLRFTG